MAARLATHGFVVVSADYTLSRPGAPSWPANLDDLREAVRWIRRHAPELGVDSERIAALGASAGGHLAALLGTEPGPSVGGVSARVGAVVDFYGPLDLPTLAAARPQTLGPLRQLLGGSPEQVPGRYEQASPIRHVSPDDPPMLLVHGTEDRLIPVDQSRAFAEALGAAGIRNRLVVVDGARHGFDFRIDERRDLLPDIVAFLDAAWTPSPATPAR